MDSRTAADTPGVLLAGRYRLLDEALGEGPAGHVVAAHDELLDRRVAVKVLDRLTDELALRRALRAARAAAGVAHPGVVRILDIQEGAPAFLVLEPVEARPLSALLERGWLPADRAQHIGAGLVAAVAALHAARAVHRDLRPDNILLTADGRTLITSGGIAEATLDTGLGERLAAEPPRPTEAPSPEQGLQLPADARSDVFALGMLLMALPETAPGPRVSAVLGRAMAQDPADRQPDAAALRDELGVPPLPGETGPPTEVPPASPPSAAAGAAPPARSRRFMLLLGLVAAAALVAATVLAVRARSASPPAAPAPVVETSSPPPSAPASAAPTSSPLSSLAPLVEEARARTDLGAETQAFVERVAALEGMSGTARAAEAAELYGIAAVDGSSDSNSAELSSRAAVSLQPELSLEGLVALVERDPALTGPTSAAFAEELRRLAALPVADQSAPATALFVRALVETDGGGLTPTFGRAVTDLLQRLPGGGS